MNKNQRNQFQFFPYHLVTPSPWPIVISFSLLGMAIGGVMSMHGYINGSLVLSYSAFLTVMCMALWFRDIVSEGTLLGDHTKQVKSGLSIGFLLFLVSEAFAFFSVFWAFFHSSLSPAVEIGGVWPPIAIEPLDPLSLPFLNTVILVSSSAYVTFGHHGLIKKDRRSVILGTLITIALALLFSFFQYFEYVQAPFSFSDSVFGTVFYAMTGLHGFHVFVGTLFILVQWIRIILYHVTNTHHLGHESAILYWHFVDLIWIAVFFLLYFWGG